MVILGAIIVNHLFHAVEKVPLQEKGFSALLLLGLSLLIPQWLLGDDSHLCGHWNTLTMWTVGRKWLFSQALSPLATQNPAGFVALKVGLVDLKGLFQPKWHYDSMIPCGGSCFCGVQVITFCGGFHTGISMPHFWRCSRTDWMGPWPT